MPREFQDFSQEVSQGTGKIKSGLDAVKGAADAADVSSGNLSSTQDAGTRVAAGYSKTMAGVGRELSGVSSAAQTAIKDLSGADAVVKSLGTSLSGLKGATSELYEIRDVAKDLDKLNVESVRKSLNKFNKDAGVTASRMDDVAKSVDSVVKMTKSELENIRLDFGFGTAASEIEKLQQELVKLEGASGPLDDLQKASFVDLSVRLAGTREFEEFLQALPEAEQEAVSLTVASKGLDAAMLELADSNELFASKLRIAAKEADEAAKSAKTYAGEVEKAGGVMGTVNEKLEEGKRQAEGFAGGLGTSTGKAIGAGVALFFVASKAAELVDKFKDAAVELSKFNVELAALESRAAGLGFEGSFEGLRDELNLTRAQSKEFFEVLRDGAASGVVSTQQLSDAALQLRDAFGGDQTARLKEYVELLKEIPTLETDLAGTASVDDKAAAVFALARSGKVETVIDLQAAGLLGGIEAEVTSEDDIKLLNAAQRTEKGVEDVSDFLTDKLFPTWGPQFSAIAEGTGKIVAGIGGAIVALGVIGALTKAQIVAQGMTTTAVYTTAGTKAAKMAGEQFAKKATPGILSGLKSLIGLGGGGGAAAGGASTAGGLAAAAAPVVIAAATVAFVAALGYGGKKLAEFGDEIISEGKAITGGLAKTTGGLLKMYAAQTLVTMALTAVTGPIGAVAGTLVALAIGGEDVGEGLQSMGDGLQETVGGVSKYNGVLRVAGSAMKATGEVLQGVAIATKGGFKKLWGGIKSLGSGIKKVGKAAVQSEEYREAVSALEGDAKDLTREMRNLKKASEAFGKGLARDQKKTQLSLLALQRQLNATASAVNSGKVAFLDFANEVSDLKLGNLSQIGGTADQFDNAIGRATSGVINRFGALSGALVKRRSDILKDSELTARDRRNALMDLKKQELDATRTFIEGLNKVVDALFQSPEILISGLDRQTSQSRFDIGTTAGVGNFGVEFEEVRIQLDALARQQKSTFKAFTEAQKIVKKGEQEFNKARQAGVDAILKDFENLPDATQKALEKTGIKTGDIDIEEVDKALSKLSESSSDVNDKINELRKRLPDASFAKLSSELGEVSSDAEAFGKAAAKAQKNFEKAKAKGDPEKIATADENLQEIRKKQAKSLARQKEISDKLYEAYGKQLEGSKNESEIRGAISEIARKVSTGEATTAKELLAQKDTIGLKKKIVDKMKTAEAGVTDGTLENLKKRQKQADTLEKTKGALEAISEGANTDVNNREQYNKALEQLKTVVQDGGQVAGNLVKLAEESVFAQQGELEVIQSQEALALMTNSATDNLFKARQKQNEISAKTLDVTDVLIKAARESLAEQKEAAAALGEGTAKKVAKAKIRQFEKSIIELEKKRGEAVQALGRTGDAISQALERFNESRPGRVIQQELDLSDVTADLARFSNDFAGAIEQSTDIAIAAANRRATVERKILADSIAQAERDLQTEAAAAGAKGPQVLAEGRALIAAKKRTEEARIELAQKQKVVDAAAREASLKLESLDLEREGVDAEMEFLSEIGGSFSSILKLQQRGVEIERQKLETLQEELAVAREQGITGVELQKKENAVKLQSFKAQKAAFGAQRDIFEKLLGKAFGELRTEIGAARRRGSDIGLLGRDRTRVVGRSGLFLKTKPGDVKPIAERAAANRVNATFGGIGKGAIGAGGGLLGEEPKRLSIEEQIADAGKTTAQYTRETAEETKKLVALMEKGVGAETVTGGLGRTEMRTATGEVANSIEDVADATKEGMQDGASLADEGREEAGNLPAGFKEVASAAASLEDKPSESPTMTADTRGGAGVGASMMPSELRVQGQINIMMDTKLFRAEMSTLVAEAMNAPEVRKAIENQGFVNSKS